MSAFRQYSQNPMLGNIPVFFEEEGEEPFSEGEGEEQEEVLVAKPEMMRQGSRSPVPLGEFPIPQIRMGVAPGSPVSDEDELKKLKKRACEEAGRVFRRQTDNRKSVCARKGVRKPTFKQQCLSEGKIYRKAKRDEKGNVVAKARCYESKAKSPRGAKIVFDPYDETQVENYKEVCKKSNRIFRKQYVKQDGTVVKASCVRKPSKKSPKSQSRSASDSKSKSRSASASKSKSRSASASKSKSRSASPKKSCPKGKTYRKSYKLKKSNKKVEGKCVKKGNRGRPRSASKSKSK
jgi:hypothetical protein